MDGQHGPGSAPLKARGKAMAAGGPAASRGRSGGIQNVNGGGWGGVNKNLEKPPRRGAGPPLIPGGVYKIKNSNNNKLSR